MESSGSCMNDRPLDDMSLTYQVPMGEVSSYTRSRFLGSINLNSQSNYLPEYIPDQSNHEFRDYSGGLHLSESDYDLQPMMNLESHCGSMGFEQLAPHEGKVSCYSSPTAEELRESGRALYQNRPISTTASDSGSLKTPKKTDGTPKYDSGKTIRILNLNRSVTPKDVELTLARVLPSVADCIRGSFSHYANGTIFMEFATKEAATTVVEYFKDRRFPLGELCVVDWSWKGKVVTAEDRIIQDNINILSVTINHMMQIMTLTDLYYILQNFCNVKKIVLCNTVAITMSTLVEFNTSQDALIAYQRFNNRNLINGRCLVQINPSTKVCALEVRTNNHKQWDFSRDQEIQQNIPSFSDVILSISQRLHESFKRDLGGKIVRTTTGIFLRVGCEDDGIYGHPDIRRLLKELRVKSLYDANPGATTVVRARGFSKSVNSSVLFNIFSTCGNVLRLKVLHSCDSVALIQYTEPIYAVLAALYLDRVPLMDSDSKIQVELSHSKEIFTGTGYCTYTCKDQRYQAKDEDKYLRSACRPTMSIWIANIHLANMDLDIKDLIWSHGLHPQACTINHVHRDITSARVQFFTMTEAVRAVAYMHDLGVDGGRLKVSFSRVRPKEKQQQTGGTMQQQIGDQMVPRADGYMHTYRSPDRCTHEPLNRYYQNPHMRNPSRIHHKLPNIPADMHKGGLPMRWDVQDKLGVKEAKDASWYCM